MTAAFVYVQFSGNPGTDERLIIQYTVGDGHGIVIGRVYQEGRWC